MFKLRERAVKSNGNLSIARSSGGKQGVAARDERIFCHAVTQTGIVAAHNQQEHRNWLAFAVSFPGQGNTLNQRRDATMSIQAHLAELERRHRALEEEINEALAHPSTDGLKIAELKRRKLQVKDEIARLRQDASIH
jgi:hypothetical protein